MKIVKVAGNPFKSTNIKSTGGRHHGITGDLTIHGVTKSVTLTLFIGIGVVNEQRTNRAEEL
jgi:polyisoprenoid-binding protein YceI